jgi:hypothetical protein
MEMPTCDVCGEEFEEDELIRCEECGKAYCLKCAEDDPNLREFGICSNCTESSEEEEEVFEEEEL